MDLKVKTQSSAELLTDYITSPTASATAVCNFWKEFDLESYRSKLDEAGLQIAENQEVSLKNRRHLAEKTKDFKKSLSPAAFKEVGPLLKQYQDEVDKLTSRAKFGESAFLDMYQKLYEAPDPGPSLAAALEMSSRRTDLEAQLSKMAQELAEYKAESSELKNQTHTIRSLQEKVRSLEAQLEEKDRQLHEAVDSAAIAQTTRALNEMREREEKLALQLAEARASLANMKQLHQATQNQLFTMQSKSEEEQVTMAHELELTTAEIERASERLVSLEKEKESLMAQVEQLSHQQEQQPTPSSDDSLMAELRAQRELASRLQSEVYSLQQQLDEETASWQSRLYNMEATLEKQEAHSRALESELAARPRVKQVEELRQQIRMLQTLAGYSTEEADEAGVSSSSSRITAPESRVLGSLETLMLDKNRHLEHELTMAKLQLAEAQGSLESSSQRLFECEAELAKYKELTSKLEEDLMAADNSKTNGRPAEMLLTDTTSSNFMTAGEDGGERTMVSVLCSQRDRFRHRVRELEEEVAALGNARNKAKKDVDAARADNVALVERLKFVQGYNANKGRVTDVESGDVEAKYQKEYEREVDPFTNFRTREREARRRQMGVTDRAVYLFSLFISSSKLARSFVFFYTLALHVLIFMMLATYSGKHTTRSTEVLCGNYCLRLQQQQQAALAALHAQRNAVSLDQSSGDTSAAGGTLTNMAAGVANNVTALATDTLSAAANAVRALF